MPKKSTSTRLESAPQAQVQAQAEATPIMFSGLDPQELSLLMEVISHECQQLGVVLSCCDDDNNIDTTSIISVSAPIVTLAAKATGALGRVLLFRASNFEHHDPDLLEDLESGICEQVDMLLCGSDGDDEEYDDGDILKDAVLIYFQTDDELEVSSQSYRNEYEDDNHNDNDDYCTRYLSAIVAQHVREYEMASPIQTSDIYNKHNKVEETFVPSIHVELDGGYTSYHTRTYFDTSTLLVFDKLVDQDLRKCLLDVVIDEDSESVHYDARDGPNPIRWVRGGLLDVPDPNDDPPLEPEESGNTAIEGNADTTDNSGGGWGLTDEGLEEICFEHHDAVVEMESILSNLFPDFVVSRLPETVLGRSVTPMTANAPTAGDVFGYHIDADPNITPSSPWTDIYGRYPNRAEGKPRFMSCLIYLNDEWDGDKWGAPTRFVDVPTDDDLNTYDVTPKPGRVIIMDQDIGHTVVAPNAAAGKRARYSLVWKLILHPKTIGQDMKYLAGGRKSLWPKTEYFGSAAEQNQNQ
eukprot:CAMPEP_0172321154 /NCGR_PEP_ID=MMETSP1058-20130122/42491_1 /TAXON_ID=83371 /ORGANISM="Detonula confervacea, Strain CCMP 353" /LENGTH=522 /DNA_ID=CAMNT_0013036585 /DNA_START=177 /DNA_END=1745 /DNA_ORIENTATION=-